MNVVVHRKICTPEDPCPKGRDAICCHDCDDYDSCSIWNRCGVAESYETCPYLEGKE